MAPPNTKWMKNVDPVIEDIARRSHEFMVSEGRFSAGWEQVQPQNKQYYYQLAEFALEAARKASA